MIRKDIKNRWIKALREDHEEVKGQLRSMSGAMDVLGVLCDVVKNEIGGRWENESFLLARTSHIYLPPMRVSLAAGLEGERVENLVVPFNGGQVPLYRLTDDTNLTHAQIAGLIEGNL